MEFCQIATRVYLMKLSFLYIGYESHQNKCSHVAPYVHMLNTCAHAEITQYSRGDENRLYFYRELFAPVIQNLVNAIHSINLFNSANGLPITYPQLDSTISNVWSTRAWAFFTASPCAFSLKKLIGFKSPYDGVAGFWILNFSKLILLPFKNLYSISLTLKSQEVIRPVLVTRIPG